MKSNDEILDLFKNHIDANSTNELVKLIEDDNGLDFLSDKEMNYLLNIIFKSYTISNSFIPYIIDNCVQYIESLNNFERNNLFLILCSKNNIDNVKYFIKMFGTEHMFENGKIKRKIVSDMIVLKKIDLITFLMKEYDIDIFERLDINPDKKNKYKDRTILSNLFEKTFGSMLFENFCQNHDYNIITEIFRNELTPLSFAVTKDNLQIIKYLYKKDGLSDINKLTKRGETPLLIACRAGNIEIINYFMKYATDASINLNQKTARSLYRSYMFSFSVIKDINIIKFMIRDVKRFENKDNYIELIIQKILNVVIESDMVNLIKNVQVLIEKFGEIIYAPLFYIGVSIKSYELVKLLFEKYNLTMDYLFTYHETWEFSFYDPILFVVMSGNIQILQYLFEEIIGIYELNFNVKRETSLTIKACKYGNIDIMYYLIKLFDFDINRKNKYQESLLSVSYFKNPTDVFMRLLKDYNADPIKGKPQKYNFLELACKRNKVIIVDYLLKNAYYDINDINFTENKKQTPLMLTCNYNNFDMIEYLVSNGADLEKTDINGNTALLIAGKHSFFNIIKYLINMGANYEVKNSRGFTFKNCLNIQFRQKKHFNREQYNEIIKLCSWDID